eukprot:12410725-Karenia_brevis.AAC.1
MENQFQGLGTITDSQKTNRISMHRVMASGAALPALTKFPGFKHVSITKEMLENTPKVVPNYDKIT